MDAADMNPYAAAAKAAAQAAQAPSQTTSATGGTQYGDYSGANFGGSTINAGGSEVPYVFNNPLAGIFSGTNTTNYSPTLAPTFLGSLFDNPPQVPNYIANLSDGVAIPPPIQPNYNKLLLIVGGLIIIGGIAYYTLKE